jgi:hypothetical protein
MATVARHEHEVPVEAVARVLQAIVKGIIEHWNGQRWELLPAPANSQTLLKLSAVSADDIWAVGQDITSHILVVHWEGHQWTNVPLPQSLVSAQASLSHIVAVSANDVWAVGTLTPDNQPNQIFLLHWDGKTWQQVNAPAASQPNSFGIGITVYGGRQMWIVGESGLEDSSALIEGQLTCP